MKSQLQTARAQDSLRSHAILPEAREARREPSEVSDRAGIKSLVIDEHTHQRVRELRARGFAPKEIARSLGVKPAIVSDLVRTLAAQRDATDADTDHYDCLLNTGWSTGLKIDGHPEWSTAGADDSTGGLVTVLVARRRRHRHGATACVYLLDVYCLGIKNAMGPHSLDDQRLRRLADRIFSGYHAPPITAPIELVRDLVFGAAEYAQRLGFAPHPDFDRARDHLGPWSGPSAITFGCNGKPTYISGPHDNPDRVLRTLRRAVGRDGFNYTVGIDLTELPLTG